MGHKRFVAFVGRFLRGRYPGLLVGLLAFAYLEGVQAFAGNPFGPWATGMRWLFALGVAESALWVGQMRSVRRQLLLPPSFLVLSVLFVIGLLVYVATVRTIAAWVASLSFYALLVALSTVGENWHWAARLAGWGVLALMGGVLPVAVSQVESRFAEEEFFSALQVCVLSLFAGLLIVVHAWAIRLCRSAPVPGSQSQQRVAIPNWVAIAVGVLVVVLSCGITIWSYRHSFYSAQAPTFPGISDERPFVCGKGIPDDAEPRGDDVLQRLAARVAANPDRAAPEYGMLALTTGERRWAEAFRRAILDEAQSANYAGPANSLKSIQYLASHRVYYLPRVLKAFPGLLSQQEHNLVDGWLAEVNRRALTVEWVDWMYGLAFSYWPKGPYENQENGAGLLALLEDYGTLDVDLSQRNRRYLGENQRGWFVRFRNTDDAYLYQVEWIDNALFQAEYWQDRTGNGAAMATNQASCFEWLLLQALPDGAPMGYNHPVQAPFAQVGYLAARLLDDPRYVWWSARVLDWAEQRDVSFYARPGAEQPTWLKGVSPDVGSCLIFGDSGLPTQVGPLAPDKIVFRDGWTPDGHYLLLNLRFSGWHRYKATNAVVLFYHDGPLVVEQDWGMPFDWMPEGRSAFRDKRIARENLNGLLVERTGMSAVLYHLTGMGGPWAQDPPHYAEVAAFETGQELDWTHTRIGNWRGWQHDRFVYFYHDNGPVVVVDRAEGSQAAQAAIAWHLVGQWSADDERTRLYNVERQMAVQILSVDGDGSQVTVESERGREPGLRVLASGTDRALQTITLFLPGQWAQAQVHWKDGVLEIVQGDQYILLPLPRGE